MNSELRCVRRENGKYFLEKRICWVCCVFDFWWIRISQWRNYAAERQKGACSYSRAQQIRDAKSRHKMGLWSDQWSQKWLSMITFTQWAKVTCRNKRLLSGCQLIPPVLWHSWLGGRKGIRPIKNSVVGCWHGCLSVARCRVACGPDDAITTHCLLLQ